MNLESNNQNLEGALNKPLDDLVKGIRKEKKKERRGHQARGRGAGRGRGLTYARRQPGNSRGIVQRVRHEQFAHGGEYVQFSRPQYQYAPRYVETRYRYAPVQYVTRLPRHYRIQGRQEYRRMDREPIQIRYEEVPRQDIRLEGTARAPRDFDRLDANRARRRQEINRRRQEGSRKTDGNKRVNKN
ncbi:ATPase alpha subunit [Perkinsela sp. CCAP 1560/4]|nr:hypothetical protein XU18_2310 [Perkinsela sp. CCAP 1560/4]KNH08422.1 ATPase alpha subunit [Perkinsela sp. CCAP 1560/4]|eukprot:KNH06952.1 hypothetical protein XU18_2310 [Perkinsela sp. CCAP 1560/4]